MFKTKNSKYGVWLGLGAVVVAVFMAGALMGSRTDLFQGRITLVRGGIPFVTEQSCKELRQEYKDEKISGSRTLTEQARACANRYPEIWYPREDTILSALECQQLRLEQSLGNISRNSRYRNYAYYCEENYPLVWHQQVTREDCRELYERYSTASISKSSYFSEYAQACEGIAAWHFGER